MHWGSTFKLVCGVASEFFSLEYSLQIQYRTRELGKREADFNAGTVEFHFKFLVGLLGLSKNRVASNLMVSNLIVPELKSHFWTPFPDPNMVGGYIPIYPYYILNKLLDFIPQ